MIELRLTEQLRKAEGVTYSPSAARASSTSSPHYGYLAAQVEVPPAKLDGFFNDVDEIVADLRRAGQRRRAGAGQEAGGRRPGEAAATNEYWLAGLSGAQTDPRRLDALRSAELRPRRVTAEDVQKAAQTYLGGRQGVEVRGPTRRGRRAATDVDGRQELEQVAWGVRGGLPPGCAPLPALAQLVARQTRTDR